MRRIIPKISKKEIIAAVPKASLGALPMLISFELGLSLLAGYYAAHFAAGPKTKEQGRLPSLVFHIKNYQVHLHHWLTFLSILVAAAIANFFIVAPFVFYGFLGGVIMQGLLHYNDWPSIVTRQHQK